MKNKLNIALKGGKYVLGAMLLVMPFMAPEKMEARAEYGYSLHVVTEDRCPSDRYAFCTSVRGDCRSGGDKGCVFDDIVVTP